MEQYFKAIEDKIKQAGYDGAVNGEEIYDNISDQVEESENGTYIFMHKQTDDTYFEYKVDVFDEQINLSYVKINTPEKTFLIDMDN